MIQELHEEIDNRRAEYIHLGRELGANHQRTTGRYFEIAKRKQTYKT